MLLRGQVTEEPVDERARKEVACIGHICGSHRGTGAKELSRMSRRCRRAGTGRSPTALTRVGAGRRAPAAIDCGWCRANRGQVARRDRVLCTSGHAMGSREGGGQRGRHAGGGRRPRRRESRWELVWAYGRVGGAVRRPFGPERLA